MLAFDRHVRLWSGVTNPPRAGIAHRGSPMLAPVPPEVARELERLAVSLADLARAYPDHSADLLAGVQALLRAARAGRV